MDQYVGKREIQCRVCDGKGRNPTQGGECDWCGGVGKRRECLRADCREYGCGGYGTCRASVGELATTS